jgi:hypothetical protein
LACRQLLCLTRSINGTRSIHNRIRQKRRHDWIEAYLVQHQRVAA